MLQKIHDRISGWVAKVVLIGVFAAFLLFGVQYYVHDTGSGSKKVLAKVGSINITNQAVKRQLKILLNQTGAPPTDASLEQLKPVALQQLVMRAVITQSLAQQGFVLSYAQQIALVQSMPFFQSNGLYAVDRFARYLQNARLTEPEFLKMISEDFLIKQLVSGLSQSAFSLPSEQVRADSLAHQRRAFDYVDIPFSRFEDKVTVKPALIEQYYQAHQAEFSVPEKISVHYILLSPASLRASVVISEPQLKQYYQDHLSNYRVPATWTVSRLRVPLSSSPTAAALQKAKLQVKVWQDRLDAGVSFSSLIQNKSDRSIVWTQETLPLDQQAVMRDLKVNAASSPMRFPLGYGLVYLHAKTPSTVRPYAQVREGIEKILIDEKVQSLVSQDSEQLANLAYTSPESLDAAARALNLPIKTSVLFDRRGSNTGLSSQRAVIKAAFSEDVQVAGNNSAPILLEDGALVVLRKGRRVPQQLKPISEVSSVIATRLKVALTETKAITYANKIKTRVDVGESFSKVVRSEGLSITAAPLELQSKVQLPLAVSDLVFKRLSDAPKRRVGFVIVDSNHLFMAFLREIKLDKADSLLDLQKTQQALTKLNAQIDLAAYSSSIKNKISIKKG